MEVPACYIIAGVWKERGLMVLEGTRKREAQKKKKKREEDNDR